MKSTSRRLLVLVALPGLLAAILFAGYRLAVSRLQGALLQALGPRSSVGELVVRWDRLELHDLAVHGIPSWPAADELRASKVVLRPDLRSALGGHWRMGVLEVDQAYVSLLRTRDGKLQVLPALLGKPASAAGERAPQAQAKSQGTPLVLIDRILLRDAQVDFFDGSVRQPPHRLQLASLQAEIRDLQLPALEEPFTLQLQALVKGPHHDGRLSIDGSLAPGRHDARLKARVSDVALVAFQPYLTKVSEGGIERGSLDLDLDATVKSSVLRAPGVLVLRNVQLGRGGSFAGVPQRAVLGALARDGRIELRFTLAGRLDDPGFSLNEDFAVRVASALADKLGVSVGGVVQGVGGLIKGILGR